MKKIYLKLFIPGLCLVIFAVSCKKEKQVQWPANNFATIGLYEQAYDAGPVFFYRRVFIHLAQIGGITTDHLATFDTGSAGLVIDGQGILPAAMITDNGFIVPGDSVVYNGITVTSKQNVITYGGVGEQSKVYGNLAYATVKIGENATTVTTMRIPFMIYYKAIEVSSGIKYTPHDHDVFGVGIGFNASGFGELDSPLGHINMPVGIDPGFKMGVLDSAGFTLNKATYMPGLLTIGITHNDLYSHGFIIHDTSVTGNITYNGKKTTTDMLMDSGTPAISILQDPTVIPYAINLEAGAKITISTKEGFNYTYTAGSTYNITNVLNTSYSNSVRNVFSIDFFKHNEYLVDYAINGIGLKNN